MTNFNVNSQQNPFLNNSTVSAACHQARVNYLDTIQVLQQFGGTPVDHLDALKGTTLTKLNEYKEEALRAARNSDFYTANSQLATIIEEWGLYKAYYDLIEAVACRVYLDASDPDTQNNFDRTLQHLLVLWTSELQNTRTEAYQQHKSDQANIYHERVERLYSGYNQMIQQQGNALNQAHEYNQSYMNAALDGAWQAQQGVRWMMERSEQMHRQAGENVNWMGEMVQKVHSDVQASLQENLKAQKNATKSIEQNLPREMEKAQFRGQMRGCFTRGCMAILFILAGPVAIGLAYLLLTHVVLH